MSQQGAHPYEKIEQYLSEMIRRDAVSERQQLTHGALRDIVESVRELCEHHEDRADDLWLHTQYLFDLTRNR